MIVSSGSDGSFVVPALLPEDQLWPGPIGMRRAEALTPGYEPQGWHEEDVALERPFTDVIRMYRYGAKPDYNRERLGRGSGSRLPPERQTLERLRSSLYGLESIVEEADDLSSPSDTARRRAVRAALQPAMALLQQELQRWYALHPELRQPLRFPLHDLLAKKPAYEAEVAFRSGNRRPIVVPQCKGQAGESSPGWPITCEHLEQEDPEGRNLGRLSKHAEEYNRTLSELVRMEAK
jgi:hypothetical protein